MRGKMLPIWPPLFDPHAAGDWHCRKADASSAPQLLVGNGDQTHLLVVMSADRVLWWFNGTVTRQTRADVARLQAENKLSNF